MRSLERVGSYVTDEVLPAHEHRFVGLSSRVRELIEHHEARFTEVIASIAAGHDTPWEIAARSGLWSPIVFPSLVKIGRELGLFLAQAQAWEQIWTSLYRALAGFALAAVAGVLLGMLMGRSALVASLLDPLFSGTYAVPKLALFPIFIFVFGIGSLSKVALIFIECLYPIAIITYHGARSVDRVLVWSAENMGASRAATLRRVVIPAALKWEVRDKLDQANVTERLVFTGLDGIARWLARYYKPRRV